jgi:hypothetical protein
MSYIFWYVLCLVALLKGLYLTNDFQSNTILIVVVVLSSRVHQCVVSFYFYFSHGLLPLLMPLSSDWLGLNINAILFANAAAVIAATAELPLLLRALLIPLPSPLCGGWFQKFTVASIAFANTTAIITTVIAIIRPPLLLLAAVIIVVKIGVSQQ